MDVLTCAGCQHANGPSARFCAQCGAPLGMACRRCGAALAAGQRFCDRCGAASADAPASAVDDGERRHATVVFSDLSGYTALAESLDPEDVERIVTRIRRKAIAVIEAHGGTVNQFVGDEVMSLFGVPHAGRDDAVRAVRAALALHEVVRATAQDEMPQVPSLTLHTGINTGLLVARPSAQHDGRYNVTGDTVNTAARLLSLAGANDVIVGADTWREIADRFDGEALSPTAVKGKQLPLRATRIVAERERRDETPLIGRDEEMALAMLSVQACVQRGGARLVVVRGEPGIGKSRLLEEVLRRARIHDYATRVAQVLDFGPARGRAGLRAICSQLLDAAATGSADARRRALDLALAERRIDTEHQPFLCALLDVPPPQAQHAALQAMDAASRRRGELAALAALVRMHCGKRPLALALEDAHWAEPDALSMWCQLIGHCATLPALFLVTTRPELELIDAARRAQLGGVGTVTIDLGPLPPEVARAMVQRFGPATDEWVDACIERAAGNPLFLEQLLINAGEAARAQVPGSIQALVLARIDRLAPAAKAILQAAAVLGTRFDAAALPALLGTDTAVDLAPLLALLRGVDGEYQFVHALVRDGVYESLLKARRRDLHTRAADWYAERDAGLQAEHLDRADSPLAAEAYLKAAMREAARWRHDRARLLAARGLQLAQVPDLRHRLAMLLGEQLREVGRNREALEQFEMARDLAAGDAQTFRAWFQVASTKRVLSEVDGAMSALDAADGVLARWGDERDRSRVAHLRGNLHFAAGRGAACEQAHQTALTHARAAGDSLCEAQALSGLGDACYAAGDMSAAERYFAACVDICDRHAFRRFAIMNRGMLAVCGSFAGKLPQALQMLPAIGGEARVLGHANAQVMVEETLGICLNMAGRHRDAQKVNDAAFELARSLGSRRYEAVAATQRVHTLRQLGQRGEARAIAEQTWRVVVEIGAQGFVGPNVLVEWAACLEPGAQRDELLSRGAMLLERGVLAHTHVWYLVEAVALRLAERRTDDAERLADALQRWPHASSVAWVSHHAQAGRALVQAQRGDWSGALRRQLEALHASAVDLCYGESAARLSDALRQGDAGPLA